MVYSDLLCCWIDTIGVLQSVEAYKPRRAWQVRKCESQIRVVISTKSNETEQTACNNVTMVHQQNEFYAIVI